MHVPIPFVANISHLYHVYVRGEEFLASGQGSAASAEFQKILIVWNWLDGREVPKDHCAEVHAQITFNFSVAGSGCARGHIQ